ncbi:phage portal protein [Microbacterium sp. NIBRBAC000506063]|nr:phage portal protein [Microbacterium sp. NIBRBAC000506063]
MVFAVSEGKLLSVQKPAYQAPTSLRLSDDLSEDYATLYRKQPSVRTVVDFLARNIAQLSLHTFQRVDDSDRKRIHDHPFAVLMREPNPYTTGYRLMRDLISDRGIYDRALWVKVRHAGRDMLVRIPPRLWEIRDDDNWLSPSAFVIKGNRGKTTIPPSSASTSAATTPKMSATGSRRSSRCAASSPRSTRQGRCGSSRCATAPASADTSSDPRTPRTGQIQPAIDSRRGGGHSTPGRPPLRAAAHRCSRTA